MVSSDYAELLRQGFLNEFRFIIEALDKVKERDPSPQLERFRDLLVEHKTIFDQLWEERPHPQLFDQRAVAELCPTPEAHWMTSQDDDI